MHTTLRDWTRLFALCAFLGAGCTGADEVIDPIAMDDPSLPNAEGIAFSATGWWDGEDPHGDPVLLRFSSSDDGRFAGDFTGGGLMGPWGDHVDVAGHWENSQLWLTIDDRSSYIATLTTHNQTTLVFPNWAELRYRPGTSAERSRRPRNSEHGDH